MLEYSISSMFTELSNEQKNILDKLKHLNKDIEKDKIKNLNKKLNSISTFNNALIKFKCVIDS